MAEDIRSAISSGELSGPEIVKLQSALTDIVGDADLASEYINQGIDTTADIEEGSSNIVNTEGEVQERTESETPYIDSGEGKGDNEEDEIEREIEKKLNSVPPIKNGEFEKWFNSLTNNEFGKVWSNSELSELIKDRLRFPGGFHEWYLVSRADVFRRWGVTAEEIMEMRTPIEDVKFVNEPGKHGGKGSTKAHNELLDIIDSSNNYAEFKARLREWAERRLKGGINSLPSGLKD